MADYSSAKTAMEELAADFTDTTADRNEAQTRFEIVDRLLRECLNWSDADINVEHRANGGIADYILGDSPRRAVIEAKRERNTFTLPAGTATPLTSIPSLLSEKPLCAAIDQVIGYAQDRGIPIAAICNGRQLAVFLASRQDGIAPRDGRALVFTSLDDMVRDFRLLWDALSVPGAEGLALYRILSPEVKPLPPEPLSDRLVDYPGYKNRNPVATEFQILAGLFLEDLLAQEELEDRFLERCYLESGPLSQYALVSKEILKKRYAALEQSAPVSTEPAVTKKGIADDLLTNTMSSALSKRPIILVGSVGVGKSIFIRRFMKMHMTDVAPNAIALYVDYGSEPALAGDLHQFTLHELAKKLRNNHDIDIESSGFLRSVYRSELFRFQDGPFGYLEEDNPEEFKLREAEFLSSKLEDLDSHLRESLGHLQKAQNRQTVIFLDNVDQRPRDFQERVFLIAQSMASSWPVTCFVSLRPDTFHSSRRRGTLAAYHPRVFTISPPRVDRVILRRLQFGLELLDETGSLPTFPEGLTLQSDRLHAYIDMLIQAFRNNDDINEFVDNMSGGNVRRALEFVVSFMGSGHVDTQKILRILEDQGSYTLPLHEFVRAVIFGDYQYYDPNESPVANVFDIDSLDGREHFLRPIIVRLCDRMASSGQEAGYVPISQLQHRVQDLGFTPLQLSHAIEDCLEKRLLESVPEHVEVAGVEQVRVTSTGLYTVRRLLQMFVYVDAMIVSTPIVDPEIRSTLSADSDITDRLKRCDTFRRYLDDEWESLESANCPFNWLEHSRHLEENINDIWKRIHR